MLNAGARLRRESWYWCSVKLATRLVLTCVLPQTRWGALILVLGGWSSLSLIAMNMLRLVLIVRGAWRKGSLAVSVLILLPNVTITPYIVVFTVSHHFQNVIIKVFILHLLPTFQVLNYKPLHDHLRMVF